MPDDRLDRTRRSLPPGYQFGDAPLICWMVPIHLWTCAISQRPHHECTCGVEGPHEMEPRGWNVIEGDHE